MATEYHVYANTGAGDAINYASPVATVSALTWTSSTLSHPATWSFCVRAFDTVSRLEDQSVDCSVTLTLNTSGQDITNQPLPVLGQRAFPQPGGSVRVEWPYPVVNPARAPTGFNVYIGSGGSPNYSSPAATVLFEAGIANTFFVNITGLTNGVTYCVGIRSYNANGEEQNTNTVSVTADAIGPLSIDGLVGIATS
jgi:hypothetical protein